MKLHEATIQDLEGELYCSGGCSYNNTLHRVENHNIMHTSLESLGEYLNCPQCGEDLNLLPPEDTVGHSWNKEMELYDNIQVTEGIKTEWWWSRTQGPTGISESIRDIDPKTIQNVTVIEHSRLETCHPTDSRALGLEITISPNASLNNKSERTTTTSLSIDPDRDDILMVRGLKPINH